MQLLPKTGLYRYPELLVHCFIAALNASFGTETSCRFPHGNRTLPSLERPVSLPLHLREVTVNVLLSVDYQGPSVRAAVAVAVDFLSAETVTAAPPQQLFGLDFRARRDELTDWLDLARHGVIMMVRFSANTMDESLPEPFDHRRNVNHFVTVNQTVDSTNRPKSANPALFHVNGMVDCFRQVISRCNPHRVAWRTEEEPRPVHGENLSKAHALVFLPCSQSQPRKRHSFALLIEAQGMRNPAKIQLLHTEAVVKGPSAGHLSNPKESRENLV
jgi:hypothetical protein